MCSLCVMKYDIFLVVWCDLGLAFYTYEPIEKSLDCVFEPF